MDKWVAVVNPSICKYSTEQINECNNTGLKKILACDDPKASTTGICTSVTHFPTFCNIEKGVCLNGFRTSEQLKTLDDDLKSIK
tara:strand:+ start:349 stop:600 length:252 start_codon:yes stop_codon:yes gene_type:complete